MHEGSREALAPLRDDLLCLILESVTDFAIFTTDPNGIVTSWSSGAKCLLGWEEDQIVGHSADVIFPVEDGRGSAAEEERRTALAEGRAEDERWHQRSDGSRFWGSGLLMPLAERNRGFVKILRDRTEQHRAEEQLRENEERFRILAVSIPQLVFRTKPTGDRTWGSPQWSVFTGLSLAESLELRWLEAVHPDDRDATLAAWADARRKGDRYYVEHRIHRTADGEWRWHQTRAAPLDGVKDADEWVGTSTDIHDLRVLQERQKVLLAELQHRTRNLLAVVQSLARQTMRTSPSLKEFGVQFESRLGALSRVQGLLARTDHSSVDLAELVTLELTPHRDVGATDRVQIEGPAVAVPPTSAQVLALAIHELATNATKYGALGQPTANLAVTWKIDEDGPKRLIRLDWRESGVAMPGRPARRGYGSELIERALPYQLRAETKLEFEPDGVRCRIAVAWTDERNPHA